MPEHPFAKRHPHPHKQRPVVVPGDRKQNGEFREYRVEKPLRDVPYAELQVTSNFTFLNGASHPEELVEQAAALGYRGLALTDRNTLGGVVRAHVAAEEAGLSFCVGVHLDFVPDHAYASPRMAPQRLADHPESIPDTPQKVAPEMPSGVYATPTEGSLLVYPTSREAYGGLSRLLTRGKRRAPKGHCYLYWRELFASAEGLLGIYVPPRVLGGSWMRRLETLREVFDDDRLSLAMPAYFGADDVRHRAVTLDAARRMNVPPVVTGDVRYHTPERRPLHDVLTCIRHGCTIGDAGRRLHAHGERHLMAPRHMARLVGDVFGDTRCRGALKRTIEISERARGFSLSQLRYQYPTDVAPAGTTAIEYLRTSTWKGAEGRYPHGVPDDVRERVESELALIEELHYEPYFLTVYNIVQFARRRGILCQGRGAAANSAVCYCLGVTAVDPARFSLLFARFISRERAEPPDIDIDFEHERREEVIQYIYQTYGRERAALTGVVITYRMRSALRDVGKALGLSQDLVDRLAKNIGRGSESKDIAARIRDLGLEQESVAIQRLFALADQIVGFPRHRSQHVGGFVITQDHLSSLVPIENCAMEDRTVIEWEKDDIAAMNMLKVDILALGILTCIRKAFELIERAPRDALCASERVCIRDRMERFRRQGLSLDTLPGEDPAVYEMISNADTVGVFQIESRAQMSMLPRLRPKTFYDLVIEVAIVRPGPIHGGMVHPYLRRRCGEEEPEVYTENIAKILDKTLGVPLFQEQAMALAIEAGGFTPGEADALRRAMAAWKRKGKAIDRFGQRLISGMLARGFSQDFADRCFRQIQGFSEYGFPESHAASFALMVYVSAWLKHYYPAAFTAALLNSQPMGFYQPAQLIRDAKEHGVAVLPIDVNASDWDLTLEYTDTTEGARSMPRLRLGLRLVRSLGEEDARFVHRMVSLHGPFDTPEALHETLTDARACTDRGGEDATASHRTSVRLLRALARADAFSSMGLDRQAALWRVRGLRTEALPLFRDVLATLKPAVPPLPPAKPLQRVALDYHATGLSLVAHPISFLRDGLNGLGVTPAIELRDEHAWPHGTSGAVAGVVVSRQRPYTAKGVVFITLEDETGISNIIVWRRVFDRYWSAARRAHVLLVRGRLERQGQVIHMIADHIEQLDTRLPELTLQSRDFH